MNHEDHPDGAWMCSAFGMTDPEPVRAPSLFPFWPAFLVVLFLVLLVVWLVRASLGAS